MWPECLLARTGECQTQIQFILSQLESSPASPPARGDCRVLLRWLSGFGNHTCTFISCRLRNINGQPWLCSLKANDACLSSTMLPILPGAQPLGASCSLLPPPVQDKTRLNCAIFHASKKKLVSKKCHSRVSQPIRITVFAHHISHVELSS